MRPKVRFIDLSSETLIASSMKINEEEVDENYDQKPEVVRSVWGAQW